MARNFFPLSQHTDWMKWAGKLTRKAAERGLLSAAARTVNYIQSTAIPAARPRPPIDRGRYRSSWKVIPVMGSGGLVGALVTVSVPYAVFIEEGVPAANVKPGKAMVAALGEWVKRKRLGVSVQRVVKTRTTKISGKEAKRLGLKNLTSSVQVARNVVVKPDDRARMRMVWAIINSMKRRGIFNGGRGLGILRVTEKLIPNFMQEEISRELAKGSP